MMVEIKRLIVAALATLACVGMWGCGDDVSMHWSEERSLGKVVGFVDDSLVIVNTSRYWHEEVEPTFGLSYDRSGYAHPGLSLYNYRVQLDGPVWSDSLDNSRNDDFEYIKGQLSDSVIWGGDPKSKVSFWKIGEKPHKMKIKKLFDGCSIDVHYTTKLRPWLDGKILVMGNNRNPNIEGFNMDSLGSEYCQYGVLDTIQKTVTYKRLDGDLKWIRKCDDVRAWDGDMYCLKFDKEERTSSLFVNDNLKYILENDYFWTAGAVLQFQGNILLLERDVCRLENGKIKCFASASSRGISFKNKEDDVYITY
ncbi:MAG: hypothetical protein MJY85_05175 [Fibrobacter sp.]|nr:hypothetical protein [Fibrobacter sp.]